MFGGRCGIDMGEGALCWAYGQWCKIMQCITCIGNHVRPDLLIHYVVLARIVAAAHAVRGMRTGIFDWQHIRTLMRVADLAILPCRRRKQRAPVLRHYQRRVVHCEGELRMPLLDCCVCTSSVDTASATCKSREGKA